MGVQQHIFPQVELTLLYFRSLQSSCSDSPERLFANSILTHGACPSSMLTASTDVYDLHIHEGTHLPALPVTSWENIWLTIE
jgi:hypothetical protein